MQSDEKPQEALVTVAYEAQLAQRISDSCVCGGTDATRLKQGGEGHCCTREFT